MRRFVEGISHGAKFGGDLAHGEASLLVFSSQQVCEDWIALEKGRLTYETAAETDRVGSLLDHRASHWPAAGKQSAAIDAGFAAPRYALLHLGRMKPNDVLRCNLCGHSTHRWLIRKNGFDMVRCRACGLVFVANPPTDDERQRFYSFGEGYHQRLAEDGNTIASHAREAEQNLAILRRHRPGQSLLDIGCSTGLFLDLASRAGWHGRGL